MGACRGRIGTVRITLPSEPGAELAGSPREDVFQAEAGRSTANLRFSTVQVEGSERDASKVSAKNEGSLPAASFRYACERAGGEGLMPQPFRTSTQLTL